MARDKPMLLFGILVAVCVGIFLFTITTFDNEPFREIRKMKAEPSSEELYKITNRTGVYSSPKKDEELGSSTITADYAEDYAEEEGDRDAQDDVYDRREDESRTTGRTTENELTTQIATGEQDIPGPTSSGNVYLTIESKGKLGNQMFQYAALYCLTKRSGAWRPYLKCKKNYVHLLKAFGSRLTIGRLPFSPSDPVILDLLAEPSADSLLKRLARLPTDRNVTLRGYFQSHRFFDDCKRDIREQFRFPDAWRRSAERRLLAQIPTPIRNASGRLFRVGVHVRRTTMIIDEKLAMGYVSPPPNYYQHAMRYFASTDDRVVFVVTSDDVDWCRRQFRADDVLFADGSFAGDLLTLTICDHVVTSVGTYSWWAGWLNSGITVYYGHLPKADTFAGQLYANHSYIPPDDRYNKWVAIT